MTGDSLGFADSFGCPSALVDGGLVLGCYLWVSPAVVETKLKLFIGIWGLFAYSPQHPQSLLSTPASVASDLLVLGVVAPAGIGDLLSRSLSKSSHFLNSTVACLLASSTILIVSHFWLLEWEVRLCR